MRKGVSWRHRQTQERETEGITRRKKFRERKDKQVGSISSAAQENPNLYITSSAPPMRAGFQKGGQEKTDSYNCHKSRDLHESRVQGAAGLPPYETKTARRNGKRKRRGGPAWGISRGGKDSASSQRGASWAQKHGSLTTRGPARLA